MSILRVVAQVIVAVAFILAIAGVVAVAMSGALFERSHGPDLRIPACATDEATKTCYWDADTRGNGEGESFIVLDGVLYTPKVTP